MSSRIKNELILYQIGSKL